MPNLTVLALFALLLPATRAQALEILDCEAQEFSKATDPDYRYFRISARVLNETHKSVASSLVQGLEFGQDFQGDCENSSGLEGGLELAESELAAGKAGHAKGEAGFNRLDRGKARLLIFVTSDADGERSAAAMAGPNCSFAESAIHNSRKFKVCALHELRKK